MRISTIATFVAMLLPSDVVHAECPVTVRLVGEQALVTEIAVELGARGIVVSIDERCPSLLVRVTHRGPQLVVVIDTADGSSSERVVGEVRTAATVIESFTRTDVSNPLLSTRTFHAAPMGPRVPPIDEVSLAPEARRVHFALTASLESSLTSDGVTWLGYNLKIGFELGPLYATARLRSSKVVGGLGAPGVGRDHNELLIGVDVPISIGRLQLSPGFAGGVGRMETRASGMKYETGVFVGEVQLSLSIPIAHDLAVDVAIATVLGDYARTSQLAPAEPAVAVRAGIGLTYRR